MDEFLTKLDVNATADVDELPNQFARLLSWMYIDPYFEPDASKVRILLRAALFLYGNLEIHGKALEQKLKDCRLIPKNELYSLLAKFHAGTLLTDVCAQLLTTITGPNHILEIQDFCHDFLDADQYMSILSKAREARSLHIAEDRVAREAKFLIITIFQLQSAEEIEAAIRQIVDNTEFNILAWIINLEESQTYFAMKCLIVQKELCSLLENGLVSRKCIASMYEISALDEDGLSIYFKCLTNSMFSSSLMTFFIKYLSTIEASNPSVDQAKLMEHDLDHVSFLIAGMLSKKSECRLEFHKRLAATSVDMNVLLGISHLNFVYHF